MPVFLSQKQLFEKSHPYTKHEMVSKSAPPLSLSFPFCFHLKAILSHERREEENAASRLLYGAACHRKR